MLFNSPLFIFYFLPIVVLAGNVLARSQSSLQPFLLFSVAASFFFYANVRIDWLLLLIGSMSVNYALGQVLLGRDIPSSTRKSALICGIAFNVLVLGWFKYVDFLIGNVNAAFGFDVALLKIALPIGISFHTFQQIAFLVDAYRREVHYENLTPLRYCFFISFFPQLVAGPIVHHSELLRQLDTFRRSDVAENLSFGIILFFIGLAKKVLLADTFAGPATEVFSRADAGVSLTFVDAWAGALSYSLQLYFDFSGYSDMAIGIAKMFGLRLPVNFDSPYKSTSIIDFWRRWHMTLSRFLRDYLYIPLGGSRLGLGRQYLNLFLTMLIGGLWHGAGWGFVIWGALHGSYLVVNHGFAALSKKFGLRFEGWFWTVASGILTLVAVIIAWIPFRAATLSGVKTMLVGVTQISSSNPVVANAAIGKYILAGFLIVCVLPNSQQLMRLIFGYRVEIPKPGEPVEQQGTWNEQPSLPIAIGYGAAAALASLAAYGLVLNNKVSEFIYFQF